MKSLVLLDLDGTLWMREIIPDSALEALKQAEANGHLILTSTGRGRSTAWQFLKDVPLSGQVYSVGSEIWMNGKRIFYKPLGGERARRIVETLDQSGASVMAEGSDQTFINQKSFNDILGFYNHDGKGELPIFAKSPLLDTMSDEDYDQVMKVTVRWADPKLVHEIMEREGLSFTPFENSDPEHALHGELSDRHYNKGTAARDILEVLGEPYRVMAFGDSENDLSMIRTADVGVAMGNAVDKLKEEADYITTDIDNDGLYNAFKHFGLLDPQQ